MATKKKYYAFYINDNEKGITETWEECKNITRGKSAKTKGFVSREEAVEWLMGGDIIRKIFVPRDSAIYIDAGTGRGIGVESRVTNFLGSSLLGKIIDSGKINEFGNYLCPEGSTNNYGELIGIYMALKYAMENDYREIAGDSDLVLSYWSRGIAHRDKLPERTNKLIDRVVVMRNKFEELGGRLFHISGDINPADLGFHK